MKQQRITDKIIDGGLIKPGACVIVGFSGGPDSLCLLHALYSIMDSFELTIVPVHVNHMIRKEANEEAENCERICSRLGLDCLTYEASCKDLAESEGMGIEEAGRIIRYQIFDDVASELAEDGTREDRIVIALAHNADDQAETVLFRLLRGTGPHGLAGIPEYRTTEAGHDLVRPLLGISRSEIESYIKENRLHPNIDRSNKDNSYARNRIRNELIPYLEENYNPKIRDNLRRYALLAGLDDSLLRDIAFNEYYSNLTVIDEDRRIELDLEVLRDDPPSLNSRVIGFAMELFGIESDVSFENISAVLELMYSSNPSGRVDLPKGVRAKREYDKLIFSDSDDKIEPDRTLSIYVRVLQAAEFSHDDLSGAAPYAAFDFDKFNDEYPGRLGDITLRTRNEGDYLPMRTGSKKIQNLLVDSKVKKAARDSILMAAIDHEVLWVLPSEYFSGESEKTKGRFSPKFHIDDTTERVLLIELEHSV